MGPPPRSPATKPMTASWPGFADPADYKVATRGIARARAGSTRSSSIRCNAKPPFAHQCPPPVDWECSASIGIGGHLAMPPLPHHRAYGSVPRRFGGLSSHQCLHWRQSETTETGFAEAAVQGFREAQPPRSFWAEDGRTGRAFGDIEATEFA